MVSGNLEDSTQQRIECSKRQHDLLKVREVHAPDVEQLCEEAADRQGEELDDHEDIVNLVGQFHGILLTQKAPQDDLRGCDREFN